MQREDTVRTEEDISFRKADQRYDSGIHVDEYNCRIGPCDVTSKPDLEKLVKNLASKEQYLNLLSPSLLLAAA